MTTLTTMTTFSSTWDAFRPTVLLTLPLQVPSQPLATRVASRRVAQKICIHALQ